jgi:tripartite-type tricarboxylate transporter receptor subunit TctC
MARMDDKIRRKEEIIATLEAILKKVEEDPKVGEMREEYQRKYGTLTEEDFRKTFTI